jgi:hypothetical protein
VAESDVLMFPYHIWYIILRHYHKGSVLFVVVTLAIQIFHCLNISIIYMYLRIFQ